MLNRKKCPRCNTKVKEKYSFCPSCGKNISNSEDIQEWGMIGKNDFESITNEIKMPAGINMLFNTLMKNIDKEMKKQEKQPHGISISIATNNGIPEKINVQGINQGKKDLKKERFSKKISENKIKEMIKLPREEPITSMKRLSNSILYEIKMPGVKSIDDIAINSNENSIEIKALTKEKTYFKVIPFGLPIINYSLEKDILILEFEAD